MDPLFDDAEAPPGVRQIADGAVHVSRWLDLSWQRYIVERFEEWAAGPVPLRAVELPGGHRMSVRTVCLGWHWRPYQYTRHAVDAGGEQVLAVPDWLVRLGRRALRTAYGDPEPGVVYRPDTALVNYYDDDAKMGMHQDKDERSDAPVVSLSIGDTCKFRFGNPHTRTRPYVDVELRSGDLFVFGGAARFNYHGVPKIYPNTADPACGLTGGRINITLRETGLS